MCDKFDFMDLLKVPEFIVKCLSCGEPFHVHYKYIPAKTELICPCCGQIFDPAALSDLQQAILNLDSAINKLSANNEYPKSGMRDGGNGFTLKAKWDNELPRSGETSPLSDNMSD